MLAGMQRNVDAVLRAKLARPHAGAVDDDVGFDRALLAVLAPRTRRRRGRPSGVHLGDLHAFDDLCAALARALGQRHGDVGRVALAVERQMHRAHHVIRVEVRIHLLDLGRRNLAHVDVEGARHGGLPVDLVLALLGQRDGDRADLPHAGGDAGLVPSAHLISSQNGVSNCLPVGGRSPIGRRWCHVPGTARSSSRRLQIRSLGGPVRRRSAVFQPAQPADDSDLPFSLSPRAASK